jgi:hypothetical protein
LDQSAYSDYQKYSEKQRKLFEIFNAYITERGGWVTSAPNQKNWVRFEVPALSCISLLRACHDNYEPLQEDRRPR